MNRKPRKKKPLTRAQLEAAANAVLQAPRAVDKARFENAPCYLCGYNGPGYFQPGQHSCAAGYHAQHPDALAQQPAAAAASLRAMSDWLESGEYRVSFNGDESYPLLIGGALYAPGKPPRVVFECEQAPPAALAVPAGFADWLAREMPAGTVIGDPQWWAKLIARRLAQFAQQPAAAVPEGYAAAIKAVQEMMPPRDFRPSAQVWLTGNQVNELHARLDAAAMLAATAQAQQPAAAVPSLLSVARGFRTKLATYVGVYPGDKELRRLLVECDEAIVAAERQAQQPAAAVPDADAMNRAWADWKEKAGGNQWTTAYSLNYRCAFVAGYRAMLAAARKGE